MGPSWFVKVEEIKDRLVANNLKTTWVPAFVSEKRFHNWLESARDWCISRGRFWGTPLPIWTSDDFEEVVVIGSIEELQERTGQKDITDIHRQFIDHLTIPSTKGKGVLRRVDEVFDCWFESGSMPYAQVHYPFENKDRFENGFPADFIAEGLDQTRGWFYTLMVLSTALFDKPAFHNCIVNGLVLAHDGKKMSKSKRNYPDPMNVVHAYGADALRLYMINSPVVRAEKLLFNEDGVKGVLKDVFLPWFNAYRFFVQNALALQTRTGKKFIPNQERALSSTNTMDKWILAASHGLIKYLRGEMTQYHLYAVVRGLLTLVEDLTNWYIKFNRKRLKGEVDADETENNNMSEAEREKDCVAALDALFEVLITLCRLMAPFTPFLTEYMYQNLRHCLPETERMDSVHYTLVPEFNPAALDPAIQQAVKHLQIVIELGRSSRERRNSNLKTPLKSVTVVHSSQAVLDDVKRLERYVVEQLNVRSVQYSTAVHEFMDVRAEVPKILGKRVGKDFKTVSDEIMKLSQAQLESFEKAGTIQVAGHELLEGDIVLVREFKGDKESNEVAVRDGVLVILDMHADPELVAEGVARGIASRFQKMRKTLGLTPTDPVGYFFDILKSPKERTDVTSLYSVLSNKRELVESLAKNRLLPKGRRPLGTVALRKEVHTIEGEEVELEVTRECLVFAKTVPANVQLVVGSMDVKRAVAELERAGELTVSVDGQKHTLKWGQDVLRF
eukprot:c17611_g1_i1.p1 GENE.c17611_g1_i1~~c17611_g1_i1.p1  ORF type:complete len:730 (+),score=204.83 c17611_g1_i1:1-2190(+)